MTIARSAALFLLAAVLEIGGAWLVWRGAREHRGSLWTGAGVVALGLYGFVATLQDDGNFGRILAAYGGVFVAGSIAWGMVADGYVLLGVGTALVYPTLLAVIGDVAHPAWRARAVGVYRLWRNGGFAVGALLAGALATRTAGT
jgi:small multidrug resistance family-3 protein